ncbi:hypothetical protein TNCV_4870401 [Trichonephila clavipes]|nr:hypothetical protein TNCV_4870401 [Trichonephila clavipes]
MPLDNKCRIGPLAGAPPTRVRWSSALRLNPGFITEDDTSQSVTLKTNPVDTAYDVGSVVSVLADVGSSNQLRSVVSLWFLLMALDVWKEKIPEGSKLANMVTNDAKMVAKVAKLAANLVNKNDANLALPPTFRQVLIE